MPAKSKVQQQAAGAALAAKRGEIPVSKLRGASLRMYHNMTATQLEHFAGTKTKRLPKRKRKGNPHPKNARLAVFRKEMVKSVCR